MNLDTSQTNRSLIARAVGARLGDDFELHPLDFDLNPGQLVGILGPNGSGKTTLLRVLSGALAADSGEVFLNGRLLGEWSPTELAQVVAVVSQKTEMQFPFSAGQVVLLGRTPYLQGIGFEREQDFKVARQAMEDTWVSHLSDRLFPHLSGGEQQRVAIARGFAQEPSCLLMDEPTASLDLQHKVGLFRLLRKRIQTGMSAAVVMHDLNQAAQWCDVVYLLNEGRLVARGIPSEVLTPKNIQEVFSVTVSVLETEDGGRFYVPKVD
ncbi:MAG TPA: ABC transporter ATP-binding protein [Myxococcales bacterium]|nr:ABC transporter ATP-binding protein [Myxococcales bacterium]